MKKIKAIQRFLRREYCNHLKISANGQVSHDACINHCLPYAFGECYYQHTMECADCSELFVLFNQLKTELPDSFSIIEELQKQAEFYLSHQTRKVYLNHQFNANLLELDEDGAVIIVDYKMKILPKKAQEMKEDFYGKREWTLHTVLVFRKKNDSQKLDVYAYDHWSTDTRQDAWFTASLLDVVFNSLDPKPKYVIIMSDNGHHYHNTEMMLVISYWKEWYNIVCKKWVF